MIAKDNIIVKWCAWAIRTRVDNKIDPATMKSALKVENNDSIQQKKRSIINKNKELNQWKAKLKLSARIETRVDNKKDPATI